MFESKTYEYILNSMLERVSDELDKREGSIIYDALAPAAAELAQMYIDLDVVLQETFGDTASREYLILRAAERGIEPYEASYAVGKGVFNIAVDIGSRFSIDNYNYAVAELISDSDHSYKMTCETAGAEPNYYVGTMTPIEYIQGLTSAELTEIIVLGEDAEETEELRKRYLNSFDNQAFGGNREDYIQKVTEIQGVGGCKVYRAWNGGGTVKLVIINSDYGVPTADLITEVQTAIDPTVNAGEGLGIAPIDHVVTVVSADEQAINISTTITYASGWDFTEAESYINEELDDYFLELNKTWQSVDNIIVRISQIESRLLDLEGVIDIYDTTINGSSSNYTVATNSIVVRGDIIG
ncbi:MAG TPA: phage tail protein [Lachnospiraceae bacterium]|nr:phage tail protein [Lachnospiraceae bacterium]